MAHGPGTRARARARRTCSGEHPGIFVSWVDRRGRSDGLAAALGLPYLRVYPGGPLLVRYLRSWRQTMSRLRLDRPSTVLVMQPPVIALLCVAAYARRSGARIAGDLHTGAFADPKWRWATGLTLRLLGGRNAVIVTGTRLAQIAAEAGCTAFVLHDVVEELAPGAGGDGSAISGDQGRPRVLVPLAHAHDEPVGEIIAAAARTPDIEWQLTGRAPASLRAAAPAKVVFTGFVSESSYLALLGASTAVVALTTAEDTMQRAGYEAMMAQKPLVTADTRVLAEFFGDSAVLVQPRTTDIAEGVVRAVAGAAELAGRMRATKLRKLAEQQAALAALRAWLRDQ
jgi:hypothetical protein